MYITYQCEFMVSKKLGPIVLVVLAAHSTYSLRSANGTTFLFLVYVSKHVDLVFLLPSFLPSLVAVNNVVYLLQEDIHHSSSSSSKDKEKERDKERKHKDEKKDKDREHKSSSSSKDKEHKSSSSR